MAPSKATVGPPRLPDPAEAGAVTASLARVQRAASQLERHCEELVALGAIPLEEVRGAVDALEHELVVRHPGLVEGRLRVLRRLGPAAQRLERDHERFPEGFTEIRGLLDVAERDDHGGNRQAVGQYGRILLEAVLRHLSEEAGLLGSSNGPNEECRGSNAGSDTVPPRRNP
jgi:hypothetical protein